MREKRILRPTNHQNFQSMIAISQRHHDGGRRGEGIMVVLQEQGGDHVGHFINHRASSSATVV